MRPIKADLQTKGTYSPVDIDGERANMQPQMCVCSIRQYARPIIICCNNARYAGIAALTALALCAWPQAVLNLHCQRQLSIPLGQSSQPLGSQAWGRIC